MAHLPLIDFRVAATVGARVAPAGPQLARAEIAEVVSGMRAAASASVEPVAAVTHLSTPADGPMLVIDRATWVRENCAMADTMLAEAHGAPLRSASGPLERAEAVANGTQIGGALALLGTRILGQFLPFGQDPKLLLVAPNVAKVERELGVDRPDFRLWVCLHEQTHRLQFAEAPWLREYLLRQMGLLLDAERAAGTVGQTSARRTGSLLDLVTTGEQRAVFDQVSAVMALLEGYADVMMDRVGPDVVGSVDRIRRLFEARRNRGGLTRLLNKLLGMDLKLAQYRDGAAFCRAVIDAVGVDGLNAVYTGAGMLPDFDEIHDPPRWIARVHG